MKTRTSPEYPPAPIDATVASYRTTNLRRDVDDGICTITFDRPDSSANIFDRDTLLELGSHLDWIEHAADLRGLILATAKEGIFVAGADLHALAGMADRPMSSPAQASRETYSPSQPLLEFIRLGQVVFNRLSSLHIPTIAAIHGACVGGGFEMALACKCRIASDAKATKIGFPEIKLGILPAWGGCTRLPRLIGIPRALDIILAGKTLPAERALKLGMVDEVMPRERLIESARSRINKPTELHRPSLRVSNNAVSAALIRARVSRELAAKTHGNYPAPFEALDVITHGISSSREKSLESERAAILRLAQTDACRNLIRLFTVRESARKRRADFPVINRSAVIGAGVMGAGIAQWLSSRGLPVILRDVSLEQLVRGMATVASLYEDAVKHHHLTALEARNGKDRVFAAATDLPMRDVDIVVEAATEKLLIKQDIFRCLAAQTLPRTILATNTSALSIADIAAATSVPERIVGLHFFNPVHRMELVEVIPGPATSPEILTRTIEFVRRIGKVPVVSKDVPGFIVNRILMPYLVEAVRLFDQGVNGHDIDEAMLDFGMPMGPLRLLDEVGLDVAAHVIQTLAKHFGERVTAPSLVERMLGAGMLGRKTGRGFYDAQDKPNHALDVMRSVHRHLHMTRHELAQRMSLLMMNEAARCVEENVASPGDIDLALILGAGFAPFRGGPLRYADALGVGNLLDVLRGLSMLVPHFAPAARLRQMAATGERFYPLEGGAR